MTFHIPIVCNVWLILYWFHSRICLLPCEVKPASSVWIYVESLVFLPPGFETRSFGARGSMRKIRQPGFLVLDSVLRVQTSFGMLEVSETWFLRLGYISVSHSVQSRKAVGSTHSWNHRCENKELSVSSTSRLSKCWEFAARHMQ